MHRQRSPGIVLVLPIDENPYQESLYGPMRAAHPDELTTVYWRRRPWIGLPGFFLLAAWCAARGARLAHIHWVLFDIHLDMPGRKSLSMITSRAAIGWLKLLRYRVIWTIHNITPHEAQTHDDLGLARELASTASKLIVHSPAVKQMLSERSISTERVVIIPQGSYLDAYQAPPSQSEARARLGLDQSRPMVLFFGLIRDYKGVLELLAAWDPADSDAQLCIVGAAPDSALAQKIEEQARQMDSVDVRIGYVVDDDVPLWLASADLVCLPFTAVTTSSSAMLALSLATPIIAPRIGTLADLPDEVGYFYDPRNENGLHEALLRALRASAEDLAARSSAAVELARATAWPQIAEVTFALYREVLEAAP